jgi:hypothetical protein
MSIEVRRAAQDRVGGSSSTVLSGLELLWSGLLSLGMLLSLETQLRWGASPVGPGELLISLWLLPGILIVLCRTTREVALGFWELTLFWAIFAVALSGGAVEMMATGTVVDSSLVIHDIIAYSLLVVLTSVLLALPGAAQRLRLVQRSTVVVGAVLALLQTANASGLFTLSGVDPWYWDRLRGWSDNPNVFGLFCLLVGFCAIALAENEVYPGRRILALTCAAATLSLGWLSMSSTYYGVVIGALGLFAFLKLARAVARAERRGFPALALTLAAVASVVFVSCLFSQAIYSRAISLSAAPKLIERKGEDDEAAVRLYLWNKAIERGLDSQMLGLGPGPHLDIPSSLTTSHRTANEPINLHHPTDGFAPNYETHNTLLELFVQGGLLAAGSFIWINVVALWRALKAGMDGLVALLFAAAAFGSFHVNIRHPLVWFAICLALVERPRALQFGSKTSNSVGAGPLHRLSTIPWASLGQRRGAANESWGF